MVRIVKTPEELKRETAELVRRERDERLDRKAKDKRNGLVLDAYDRLAAASAITPNAVESMPRSELEQTCAELERFRQERSNILAEVVRLNAWADELGKRAEAAERERDALRLEARRVEVAFQWIDYWGGNEQSRADAGDIVVGNYTVDGDFNLIGPDGRRIPR